MPRHPLKTFLLVSTCLVAGAGGAAFGLAQEAEQPSEEDPIEPLLEGEDQDRPAVIVADELIYEERGDRVVARGRVEIYHGARILRADEIVYDRRTGVVTATGNVFIVQDTGEVIAADRAEVTDDLRDAFVERISLLLADNTRLIAESGRRTDGRFIEVERAVYSPCLLCEENPRRPPLWQIRAARVRHDAETKDIVYRDAYFDFMGVPIFYTPYFSHPDPTVERRSGFLIPLIGRTSDLGMFVRSYYYWDILPSVDTTIELGLTEDAGFVLGAEYRQRFEHGAMVWSGSVNQSDYSEVVEGIPITNDDELRGHLFGQVNFDIDSHWRAGADIAVASDDTYLDTFEYSGDDLLRNRVYAEGFYGLSYAVAEAYAFQDLREDAIEQATILPWLRYSYMSEPDTVLGGQVTGELSFLQLQRENDFGLTLETPTEGVDTTRVSLEGAWHRIDYTSIGLVTELSASLRGDLYISDDLPDPDDPDDASRRRDGVIDGRIVPRATAIARMPFVRTTGSVQQLIEPIVGVTAAPVYKDEENIPNNDSLDFEFDANNLFSESRYPGIDRVDGGVRITYGMRGGLHFAEGGSISAFLGQSYSFSGEDTFPPGSGLNGDFSDIVGSVVVNPTNNIDIAWRFRFDTDEFDAEHNEVTARVSYAPVRFSANYTFAKNFAETTDARDTDELSVAAEVQLTDYWSVTGGYTYDLEADASREYSVGLRYLDECFDLDISVERDFTTDRDRSPGTSVFVRLDLLTLGNRADRQ